MTQNPQPHHAPPPAGHPQRITDADESRSADMRSRTIKYTVSMSVRLACFIAAFFVHGWLQVVMLVLAVILPYFAVIVANASGTNLDKRSASNYYDAGPPSELTGAPAPGTAGTDHADDDDHRGPHAPSTATEPEPEVLPGELYTPEAPDTREAPEPDGADRHHRGRENHSG